MNKYNSPQLSNLEHYILQPLSETISKRLEGFLYYDATSNDQLTANDKGIDVISHQLELKFENTFVFFSWDTIDGWFQYSLCISNSSIRRWMEPFAIRNNYWNEVVGAVLKTFKVYGYKENTIETRGDQPTTYQTYYNEHLVVLHFDNGNILGIANFYYEKDFDPMYSFGDDVWIIFDPDAIERFIKKLGMEQLDY